MHDRGCFLQDGENLNLCWLWFPRSDERVSLKGLSYSSLARIVCIFVFNESVQLRASDAI